MARKKGRAVGDMAPAPYNPRSVTADSLEELGRGMREFGDLSPVVFNVRTERLVGGHQRARHLPEDARVEILRTFKEPTPAGTVALGTVEMEGELFLYREVDWPEDKERTANVRANVPAGEWDRALLAQVVGMIREEGFDESLTGLDAEALSKLAKAAAGPDAPDEFGKIDPDALPTDYRCPRCAYEWSGNPQPQSGASAGEEGDDAAAD